MQIFLKISLLVTLTLSLSTISLSTTFAASKQQMAAEAACQEALKDGSQAALAKFRFRYWAYDTPCNRRAKASPKPQSSTNANERGHGLYTDFGNPLPVGSGGF
jgi:hypothetical protein